MKWNPDVYECPKCKKEIWSKSPGHYCSCSCGNLAVDQTEHYTRIIGDISVQPKRKLHNDS